MAGREVGGENDGGAWRVKEKDVCVDRCMYTYGLDGSGFGSGSGSGYLPVCSSLLRPIPVFSSPSRSVLFYIVYVACFLPWRVLSCRVT